jgi:hypothetical protein
MKRTTPFFAVVFIAAACSPPEADTTGGGKRPKVPIPASAAAAAATRPPKITLPPPMAPPPKPDGQPQSAGDLTALARAAAAGQPVQRAGAPTFVVLDDARRKIGGTIVDTVRRRVEIPAKINMVTGILEYMSCASDGKLHESVLEQLDRGSHLHIALLLLDQMPAEFVNDEKTGPRLVRQGSPLRVSVEFADLKTGKTVSRPAESFLYSRKRKGSPKQVDWVFQGSTFWNGDYSADTSKSIMGLVPDPTTVIAVMGNEGNPYQGMEGFEVHTKAIPPKGTPVTLVIEPAAPPPQK